MKGDRANKVKATEYTEGFYTIRQVGNFWEVVDDCIAIDDLFSSLNAARKWCKEHPADPEICGKWA